MTKNPPWQQFCPVDLHNLVCGERELRGDRRRKGERSLLSAAALPFCTFLLLADPVQAQPAIEFRAGLSASSTIIRDLVASPQLRQLLGGRVDEEVTMTAAPAATFGLGMRLPLRPRLALDAGFEWTATHLRVTDGGGTRSLDDLGLAQATAGVNWAVGRNMEVGAAMGVLKYVTERRGVFAEGSQIAPLVEGRVGWTVPAWSDRIALAGSAQMHRFGTPAMRQMGGEEGIVNRFSLIARIRMFEVGR
ncbi:hypothetical protein BH23GEM9_BH23GEM9_02250 [soil metagenome]